MLFEDLIIDAIYFTMSYIKLMLFPPESENTEEILQKSLCVSDSRQSFHVESILQSKRFLAFSIYIWIMFQKIPHLVARNIFSLVVWTYP